MDKNIFYKLLGKEEPGLLERNKELIKENEYLKKTLGIQQGANKSIADRCIVLENKLELLEKDAEQYIEVEVQRSLMELESKYQDRLIELENQYKDQMNHRWYSLGRTDAYAEMGIRALNSRKAGTTMYYLKNTGEVIEDITNGLEDVKPELTNWGGEVIAEIEIEDLQDA